MTPLQFTRRLDDLGVRFTQKSRAEYTLHGKSDGQAHAVEAKLNESSLELRFRFSEKALRISNEETTYLLELNDQLTVFKLALDEHDRVELRGCWRHTDLSERFTAYLVLEIFRTIEYLYDSIQETLGG